MQQAEFFILKKNQFFFSGHKSSKRHVDCVHGSSSAGVSMKIRHAITSKGGGNKRLSLEPSLLLKYKVPTLWEP
jgi:hypothetical protein